MTNVSRHGFWLLLDDRELFVPFAGFPWFRDATVGEITAVERPSAGHLCWPQLDVDLAVESIEHPERYPLVSRVVQRKQPRHADVVGVGERKPAYGSSRRACRR